jgi:GT2 family glycosyltransferase
MNSPTIAVCIPTYNQSLFLQECLESVFSQTLLPNEVWISDDASSDNTFDVVMNLKKIYPNIHYVRQSVRLGMSGNPRWVVQQPKTDFIAKLDSDDKYHPHYLEKLVSLLLDYPDAGYAHADAFFIDKNSAIVESRQLFRHRTFIDADSSLSSHTLGFKVTANIIVYRRSALEDVDYFRPSLTFCDDWDIGVRLADKGWGNVYCSEYLVYYRVWTDAEGLRPKRILDRIESTIIVYDQSLLPAFTKRMWPLKRLNRARSQLALHLARRPELKLLDSNDHSRALILLKQLSSTPLDSFSHIDNPLRSYVLYEKLLIIIKAWARRLAISLIRLSK